MRFRSTLFLAVLCAALGGYLYFVEFERAAQEDVAEKLLDVDPDLVSGITLEHPGRTVTLERVDGAWRLTAPVEAAADERAVTNLINAVRDSAVKRTLDDVENLAAFGLDAPSATVQLRLVEGELPLIKLGKNAPMGDSAYVQRADRDPVFLTAQSLATALDKKVDDLRDKSILVFDNDDVESVRLSASSVEIALRRSEDGWHLEAPFAGAADEANVRSLLTTLRSLRATGFENDAPEDLAAYGLAKPAQSVTLGLSDGGEIALLVGDEKKGQLLVKSSQRPTVYQAATFLRANLDKDADHYRDKTILSFDSIDVATLRIDRAEESLTLNRDDAGGWSVAGSAESAKSDEIDTLIGELERLTGFEIAADGAADIPDLAAYGLAPPTLTITVLGRDDADLGTVRLGTYIREAPRTDYAAIREGGDTVFHIRQYVFDRLDKSRGDLVTAPEKQNSATDEHG